MTAINTTSVFLGLDYGLRRIGLAAGDATNKLAFAVGAHVEGRDGSILKFLQKIIDERKVTHLVIGLPLQTDGSDGDITQKTRRFAKRIEEEFSLPVFLWDERYTSQEADHWLKTKRKKSKEDRDALAAEIILQSFLESHHIPGKTNDVEMDP
ncbi:MAG: Holliday junction resolvase RuvX [bacterium]|nr:Holliday junction resolvase RuvX [bacterium]